MNEKLDLARFIDMKSVASQEPVPGYRVRFVHSDTMTVAHWVIRPDSPLPEHHHVHEQIVNVLEGSYELTVGGESRVLEAGDVAVIPSGVPHSGRSLTACRILDVFHPVREDYRASDG